MVKDAALWIFSGIMDALAGLLSLIPVPAWVSDFAPAWAGLSGTVGYWVGPFQLGYGVSVIIGAYAIRFLIRRLPIIG
jgi:hypothetical protein